jgi:hypothetical protein
VLALRERERPARRLRPRLLIVKEGLRRHAGLLLAVASSLALLAGLRHEFVIGRYDLNDHSFHGPIVARVAEALQHGENPLDCWMDEWALGHAVTRTYQPLPHVAVALLWLGTFKAFDLQTLFIVVRTLVLAAWPLSVYACARLLRLERWNAACCALVAPLVATAGWYGLELGSYAWRGSGLFTQLFGMHALAFAFALGVRALRWDKSCTLAALAIALTFGCHLVYGQVAALSVAFAALCPFPETTWRKRLVRLGAVGALTGVFAAWQLGPLLADAALVNTSRWEAQWKWDSVGLTRVGELLWKGQLLDEGRAPVLTLLAATGIVFAVVRRDAMLRALAILAGAWTILFAGRVAWGPWMKVLGFTDGVPVHRLIGGAHFFLILVAGCGLGELARFLTGCSRRRVALAALLVGVVLFPAWRERARWLGQNDEWGARNLAANRAEAPDVARLMEIARQGGGRVYPGLAAKWGGTLRIGDVPLYARVSEARIPALAFLYHSMSLTSDAMVLFDEGDEAQYRVFGVTRVLASKDQPLPAFLTPIEDVGRFRAYAAPGEGFFDVVSVPARVACDRRTLYDVSSAWLVSPWPARRRCVALDLRGAPGAVPSVPSLSPGEPLPDMPAASPGRVESEHREREIYDATISAGADAFVLFKMTWNPRWRLTIDGVRAGTFPVAPGFVAAPVAPGRHEVHAEYEPGRAKLALLALVPLVAAGASAFERRGLLRRAQERIASVRLPALPAPSRQGVVTALLLLACCAPFLAQLLTSLNLRGHDHLSYLARVTEMHENVRHGILLPRWAPDLGSGHGQPLFLFAPPFLYWLAELFHLAGFGLSASMNLATAALVVASAFAMHRLVAGRFGVVAGRVAALAYVLAPYFCVEIFVRSAFAEMAAFPLEPLVLDGLLRHDRDGRKRWLVQSALAWAALAAAHPPAALLFAPVPPALVLLLARMKRDRAQLATQSAALGCGLLVSAFAWLPGLVEKRFVQIDNLLAHPALRYDIHFVQWKQLLVSPWGYGISVAGPGDGMSFELGRVHVALAALALIAAWRVTSLKPARPILVGAALVVLGAAFMSTTTSRPIWDAVKTLQYVQFEWRFLAVATPLLALLVGASIAAFPEGRPRNVATALVVVALLAVNLPHAQASGRDPVDETQYSPDAIARGGVGVTTANEYEPTSVLVAQPYDAPIVASQGIVVRDASFAPERQRCTVDASLPGEVWFRTSSFPGWTTMLDGRECPHRVATPSGFLIVDVPAGTHELAIRLKRTPVERAGLVLSAAGLAGLAIVATRRGRAAPGSTGASHL